MNINKEMLYINPFGMIGLIFSLLKIWGLIGWSWVWVLSPFWIPMAAGSVVMVVIWVIQLIYWLRFYLKKGKT